MKNLTLSLIAIVAFMYSPALHAQVPVKPEHVIIVMEENYAYSEIIGSNLAPTFTWLSTTPYTANFTQDFAITHPSEPNYLELFSGSNQGITVDEDNGEASTPGTPFNDCNMGSSLIQHGYTFIGYSEDQPSNCSPGSCVGWTAGNVEPYEGKHCPWTNWMVLAPNGNPDTIPIASDVPYNYNASVDYKSGPIFPDSNHYSSLPTVAWVIPNSTDDMHTPFTESVAVPAGDSWFKTNMMPLVRWATNPANKAIVITVWDEDDGNYKNNVPLLVSGGMVNGGNYTGHYTHYDLLRTIEDMYGLSLCGASASGSDWPTAMWNVDAGVNSISQPTNEVATYPNPAKDELNIKITSNNECNATLDIYDVTGRKIKETPTELKSGENTIILNTNDVSNGVYFLTVTGANINLRSKIVIAK